MTIPFRYWSRWQGTDEATDPAWRLVLDHRKALLLRLWDGYRQFVVRCGGLDEAFSEVVEKLYESARVWLDRYQGVCRPFTLLLRGLRYAVGGMHVGRAWVNRCKRETAYWRNKSVTYLEPWDGPDEIRIPESAWAGLSPSQRRVVEATTRLGIAGAAKELGLTHGSCSTIRNLGIQRLRRACRDR